MNRTHREAIRTEIKRLGDRLGKRVEEETRCQAEGWLDEHGIEGADKDKVLGRQAVFGLLLKTVLIEEHGASPSILADDPREGLRKAASEHDDDRLSPGALDEVAALLQPEEIETVLGLREHLRDVEDVAEAVGWLFEHLTPQEHRRRLGQFRTPPDIAELMATWVTEESPATLLDPGMGAGILTENILKVQEDDVSAWGIEKSPIGALMATVSMSLSGGDGPQIVSGDFFDTVRKDGWFVEETAPIPTTFDAIISNPPYTRHHELGSDYKERLKAQIESATNGSISALSPLYLHFYIHALDHLSEGARLSFITPSEFLQTRYGTPLKEYILENYRIDGLLLFNEQESAFDHALTTSCISFIRNEPPDDVVRFIRVDDWPGIEPILDAVQDGTKGQTEWGFVNGVRVEDLDPESKWTELFQPLHISETEKLLSLGELLRVRRGIATGKNSYFCLDEKTRKERDIPSEYLEPLVRGSGSVPHYSYTDEDWRLEKMEGEEVWLLYLPKEHRDFPSSVEEYLEHGRDQEAHESYLAKNRDPWYAVDRREAPPILYTYMSRNGGRFVFNDKRALNLNNLHGLTPRVELTDLEVKALLAFLNSTVASELIRRSGRSYATGMDKIEPNELESVVVLDPRKEDENTIHALAEAFDNLDRTSREGETTDARGRIDELLIDDLGIDLEPTE